MSGYRDRILDVYSKMWPPVSPAAPILDFGAGDGWFASRLSQQHGLENLTAVDVQARPKTHFPVTIYGNGPLPHPDRHFELVYCIDVLHHCSEPEKVLAEILRCCGQYFLLKDHNYQSFAGWLTLCALDEIGNRRFGIPSRYHYMREWSWWKVLEDAGFTQKHLVHPAPCHTGLLGTATNSLQFVSLWERGV